MELPVAPTRPREQEHDQARHGQLLLVPSRHASAPRCEAARIRTCERKCRGSAVRLAVPFWRRRLLGSMSTEGGSSSEDLRAAERSGVSPDVVRSYRYQLTPGEDVIDPATWAGSVPQRTGSLPGCGSAGVKWFNLLWLLPIGFLFLIVAVAAAKGLRGMPSVQRFIGGTRGRSRRRAPTHGGLAGLGRRAALLQSVLDDLHHPLRDADPERPSSPVLDAAQHPGQGLVPRPEAGTGRSALDRQAGLDQPARPGRSAGDPPLDRPGPLVAPRHRRAVAAERAGLLRAAVRDRAVARVVPTTWAVFPERGVGADPVPVVALADRERVGRLQRPAAARLLHHRLRRRPARADHRAGHVAGAVDPV